jgi:hypothetical protein
VKPLIGRDHWKVFKTLGECPARGLWDIPSLLHSHLLLSPKGVVLLHHTFLLGGAATSPKEQRTKTTMSQNKLSSLKLVFSDICYRNAKLTNTYIENFFSKIVHNDISEDFISHSFRNGLLFIYKIIIL